MRIPSLKYISKKKSVQSIGEPEELLIPLSGYSSDLVLLVKAGDRVLQYQLIAETKFPFYMAVHAPVAGIIGENCTIDGQQYVELKNDKSGESLTSPKIVPDEMEWSSIIEIIRKSGIVGSGGAGFPTYLKYNVPYGSIDTLIVNAVECEPYLTADYAVLKQFGREVLKVLALIQKKLAIPKVIIAIEEPNKDLVGFLKDLGREFNFPIDFCVVPDNYPEGGELQLIYSVTGKKLKKGTIPAREGVLVSNVGTVYAVYEALYNWHPYTRRIVTVSGNNSSSIGNYSVAVGTPLEFLLSQLKLSERVSDQKVILGGPMMGTSVQDYRRPLTKLTGGVLILDSVKKKATNCIRCGYCVDVCPQHLMPMEFVRNSDNLMELKNYNLSDCILCGACAYSCPAEVPLMESIKKGQYLLKKGRN